MDTTQLAVIAVALGLFFNFSNGFHDASNIVSTIVSTRAMSLHKALMMTATLVFVGSVTIGTSVARTIGGGIVRLDIVEPVDIVAAVTAASAWNIITWVLAIPSSSSHALMGGLMGAAFHTGGVRAVHTESVIVIFLVIFAAPPVGFACAWAVTRMIMGMFADSHPAVAGRVLRRLQNVSAALLALSHGANDAQKTMGIISMTFLVIARQNLPSASRAADAAEFGVPPWVIVTSSLALSLGMLVGAGRIIRTVGTRFFRIKPHHGLGATAASSAVVYACTLLGFPVSTTHIASSCVLGSGAAQRASAVRWALARDIALTWIVTLPASGAIAYLLAALLE